MAKDQVRDLCPQLLPCSKSSGGSRFLCCSTFPREGYVLRSMSSILDKDRIIAAPGYNRWLVPPAALAIHLSIGMAYGFSVFWLPLSKSMGVKVSQLGWVYTLFFVFLGSSAAVFGPWLERV